MVGFYIGFPLLFEPFRIASQPGVNSSFKGPHLWLRFTSWLYWVLLSQQIICRVLLVDFGSLIFQESQNWGSLRRFSFSACHAPAVLYYEDSKRWPYLASFLNNYTCNVSRIAWALSHISTSRQTYRSRIPRHNASPMTVVTASPFFLRKTTRYQWR